MKKIFFGIISIALIVGYTYLPVYCSTDRVIDTYVEMIESFISGNGERDYSTYCILQVEDDSLDSYYTWLKVNDGYIGFISSKKTFVFADNDFDGADETLQKKLYARAVSYNHSGLNLLLHKYPPNKYMETQ
jgi:hypothetical protein